MSNLAHRQSIIQEKRKTTPWRKFVMEICSQQPTMFYKNQKLISRYPESSRLGGLINPKLHEWNKDDKNYTDFGSQTFFTSFQALWKIVEKPSLAQAYVNENADYGDVIYGTKNTYLSFSVGDNTENVLYSHTINTNCRNVLNSFQIYTDCENVYRSVYITNSSNIFFSKNIHNSYDVYLSYDCIGCKHLFACKGLVNQEYCIENTQCSPEEYKEKIKSLKLKTNLESVYYNSHADFTNIDAVHSSGIGIVQCLNVHDGRFVKNVSYGNNLFLIDGNPSSSRIYDTMSIGLNCHDFYAANSGGMNCSLVYCSTNIGSCSNIYYSDSLQDCSFCLGCVGLQNKQFCILNKQYTKEERYEKVDEIFGQMHEDGVLGDFFPATMNPFYFNDTAAYLIDPTFTKEEVTVAGYLRRDEPIKVDIPAGVQTVSIHDLDKYEGWKDGKRHIDDEILKKVILDDRGNAYRIIPMELEFLRKYELPLPRKHWLDRMKENFRIS